MVEGNNEEVNKKESEKIYSELKKEFLDLEIVRELLWRVLGQLLRHIQKYCHK